MKRYFIIGMVLFLLFVSIVFAARDVEIQQKKLISQTPPFTVVTPSEFKLVHSDSFDFPKENSRTRSFLFIKEKNKQIEEMFIVQISDKTNPQASPMTAPSLKPYMEKRMYSRSKIKKGDLEIEHLTQLMEWNPDATSLQPIVKKRMNIPKHLALQGQFQFIYLGEHGVHIRYSKDVNSFGLKVSGEGKGWDRDSLSGNEKKVYETFQRSFTEMVNSITLK